MDDQVNTLSDEAIASANMATWRLIGCRGLPTFAYFFAELEHRRSEVGKLTEHGVVSFNPLMVRMNLDDCISIAWDANGQNNQINENSIVVINDVRILIERDRNPAEWQWT